MDLLLDLVVVVIVIVVELVELVELVAAGSVLPHNRYHIGFRTLRDQQLSDQSNEYFFNLQSPIVQLFQLN